MTSTEDRLTQVLEKAGLTHAEYQLLSMAADVSLKPSALISNTMKAVRNGQYVKDQIEAVRYRRAEYEEALSRLLTINVLRVVTRSVLADIKRDLQRRPAASPYDLLPSLGQITLNKVGIRLWKTIETRILQTVPNGVISYEHNGAVVVIYSCTREQCWEEIEYFCGVSSEARHQFRRDTTARPIFIGPWRDVWWRRFPRGYYARIRIDE